MKIIIPGELPGENEIIRAAKSNRYKYQELKKRETHKVQIAALQAKQYTDKKTFERVELFIIWHCKNRKKDPDNIMAGIKFILDGIVKAGIIPNDGWRHVAAIRHEVRLNKELPCVEVLVVDSVNDYVDK